MAIAGVFGFILSKYKFSSAALILGLVLGPMIEANLRRAVQLENGSILNVISPASHPITAVLLILCVMMLFFPILSKLMKKKIA